MKVLKENANGIIFCLFEVLVGILLLINPVAFTAGIIIALGLILMVAGLVCIIKYFRADPQEAAVSQLLLKGLVALLAGAFCVFQSHWFIVTFPVLTILYGVAILVTGLGKVQLTVDMLRQKNKKWFLAAISAAVSIVCAIVILNNPFTSATILWMFTGITLIAEAVFDIVTLIMSTKKEKPDKESEQ